MSPPRLCRLCVKLCKDAKSLYDDNGCGTDIYEVTYKYFHPLILDMEKWTHLTALCLQCWRHIRDFQDFQLSVQAAQENLIEGVGGNFIKTEVEDPDFERIGVKVEDEENLLNHYERSTWTEESRDEKPFISQPELELMDVNEDNPDGSDEEWVAEAEESDGTDSDTNSEEDDGQFSNLEANAVDPDTYGNDDSVDNKTIKMFRDKWQYSSDTLDDRLAKWMPNINCVVCSETWPKYSLLREHFLQSHPNKEFYIACCSRKLCAPFQIDDHLRLHNDPDAYKCHLCDKAYTLKSSLNRHITTRHPKSLKPKMCICQKCGKGFDSKRGLGRHYFVRHPDYHKSRRECPPEVPAEELPTTSSKRAGAVQQAAGSNLLYPCNECGKIFQKYISLRRHRWYNHKIRTKAASIVMVRENPEGPKKVTELVDVAPHHKYSTDDTVSLAECGTRKVKHERKAEIPTGHQKSPELGDAAPHHSKDNSDDNVAESGTRKIKHETEDEIYPERGDVSTADNLQDPPINADPDVSSEDKLDDSLDDLLTKWMPNIKCQVCRETYTKLSLLQDHFVQHHPTEKFYISCCTRKLSKPSLIKEHLLLHNDPQAFKCTVCDSSYATKRSLKGHMTRKHPSSSQEQMYPCKECLKNFTSKQGLSHHYTVSHGTSAVRYRSIQFYTQQGIEAKSECVAETGDTANANHNSPSDESVEANDATDMDHSQADDNVWASDHSDDPGTMGTFDDKWLKRKERLDDLLAKWMPTIKCVQCPNSYANLQLLQDHFQQSHPEDRFYISCCNRKLPGPFHIEEHLLFHNDPDAFKCRLCGKSFTIKYSLKRHMTLQHPAEGKKDKCKKCGKSFKAKWALSLHKKVCRVRERERPANPDVPADRASSTPNIKCVVCQESFAKLSLLRSHFSLKHPDAEFYFLCCSRKLTALWQIEEHLLLHNDPEAFKCVQCDRTYLTKKNLRIHTNRHHPDAVQMKYTCSQCHKSFPTTHILTRHYTGKHSVHGGCATTKHYDQRARTAQMGLIMQPCAFCPKKFISIGRSTQTLPDNATTQ